MVLPELRLRHPITKALAKQTLNASTHFKDELERNGGIITHVVGADNVTSAVS